jgi:PTH1 family peptidyl-tRNA hydrolase
MRSIIYQLGDDGFPRFRLGIGADLGEVPLHSYVLAGFEKEDLDPMSEAVIRCADAIETALSDGIDAAMLKFNASAKKAEDDTENDSDKNSDKDSDE